MIFKYIHPVNSYIYFIFRVVDVLAAIRFKIGLDRVGHHRGHLSSNSYFNSCQQRTRVR
jgi:hypothetical protein